MSAEQWVIELIATNLGRIADAIDGHGGIDASPPMDFGAYNIVWCNVCSEWMGKAELKQFSGGLECPNCNLDLVKFDPLIK